MNWLTTVKSWFGISNSNPIAPGNPSYDVLYDWIHGATAVDKDLKTSLARQRNEARLLSRENPLVRQYLDLLVDNVIGPKGIKLQAQVRDNSGNLNKLINDRIEDNWAEFWKSPWADGRFSGIEGERLLLRNIAVDGEAFVRLLPGYNNRFGFALQMIDAELIDHTHTRAATDGSNEIRCGIEVDGWGKPVAYWITDLRQIKHRVPAEQIIHLFRPDRIGQSRGISWLFSNMTQLRMLDAYKEAEVIAARLGASQMMVFKYDNPEFIDEKAPRNYKIDVQPGKGITLPPGLSMQQFDPKYPNANGPGFDKSQQRYISTGLPGATYNTLTNDYEAVNFSSLRACALVERDAWRTLQQWFISSFRQPVFEAHLAASLLTGALRLDSRDPAKFRNVRWFPRGWAWVDPLKEINAAVVAIKNGMGSRTSSLAENGEDFETVLEELADEADQAAAYGIDITDEPPQPAAEEKQEAPDDTED